MRDRGMVIEMAVIYYLLFRNTTVVHLHQDAEVTFYFSY